MSTQTQTHDTARETVVPLTSEHPVARVDLMPPEVLERRRFKRAQSWMVVGLVGVVAVQGAGYYLASADAASAADALALEQARTTVLQTEAAKYAQVPAVLASVDRAETALSTAMVTDIEWYRYLSQIADSVPEGVWFETVTATALPPGVAGTGDPLAPVDAVAEISVTGSTLDYPGVATWLDSLDGISNLDYVLSSDATLDADTGERPWVDFTTTAKVSPEAYSDRYAPEGQ